MASNAGSHCVQNDGRSVRDCTDSHQPIGFFQGSAAWSKPKGEWVQIASTSSGSISQGASWGTSTSDRNGLTTNWGASLSASTQAGVLFAGGSLSASTSVSIAKVIETADAHARAHAHIHTIHTRTRVYITYAALLCQKYRPRA